MAQLNRNLINQIFNEEAGKWYQEIVRALQDSLQKRRITASEELLRSLSAAVTRASEGAEGKISLSFQEYGRYRDMRKLIYTSQPPVDDIKDWIKSIGLDKFKYIPGYRNSNRVPTRDIALNRIAWSIARGIQKRHIVKRAKRQVWYASPLYTEINKLENRLAKRYADMIVNEIKNATK